MKLNAINKKIFNLVLISLFFLISVFMLTACGEKPYVTNFYLTDSAGNKLEEYEYLGEFDYGTSTSRILPDVSFYVTYSDNSVKQISASDVQITYFYGSEEIENLSDTLEVGDYYVEYHYQDFTKNLSFYIQRISAPNYFISLSKNLWEYDEKSATLKLYNYQDEQGSEEVKFYYIEKDVYDKASPDEKENFYEELSNHISAYSQGQLYHIMPGQYYAFAKIPETKIYNETFTVINSSAVFTVQKSSLTVDESILDNLIGTYGYYIDHLEDITLDNLYFHRSTDNLTGDVLFNLYDKNEEIIPCRVDWVSPDTVINSLNDGDSYFITAVVDEQYRDYYEILHIEKEIKIEVDKLEIGLDFELENSFSADETSGMEYDYIYNIGDSYRIYLNGLHYDYDKVIQIFDNNSNLLEIKKIDINDYSVEYYVEIEMKNPGQYFIEARLLNKQNSCWDSLDSEPKTFNYEIVSAEVLDVSGEFAVQEFDGNVEGENLPLFVKYMNDWFSTNMANVANSYTSNVYLTYSSPSYNAKFKIDSFCSFTNISPNQDFTFNFTMNKYIDEEQVEYSGTFTYFKNEFMNDVYSQNQLVTSITGYNSIDNLLFNSARIDYPQIVAETENPIYYVATDDNFLKVKTICTWEQNGKNIDCEIILVFDNGGNYIGHQVSYNDGEMSYCLQNKLSYTIL